MRYYLTFPFNTDPLTMPNNADIIVTFDNEQKVGQQSGGIREGSKQPMSVITTVAVIQPSPISHNQFQPYNRLNYDIAQTLAAVEQLENKYLDSMQIYRNQFIMPVCPPVRQVGPLSLVVSRAAVGMPAAVPEHQDLCQGSRHHPHVLV